MIRQLVPLFLVGLCLLTLGPWSCDSGSGDHDSPRAGDSLTWPLNVGHGGAKHLCPANTVECYRHALRVGANALEADLQVLGDGTLVMFHDNNTLEQTGEDNPLGELTIDRMKELDAGWGFTPDGGTTYPYRGKSIRIPTFEEFLDAFSRIPVLLDVKVQSQAMAASLEAYVTDRFDEDAREFVYIKTHDQHLTDRLRSLQPRPQVAFNTGERILLVILPGLLEDIPPTWLDLNPEFLFPHVIEWSEAHNHILTTSTINDAGEMEAYLGIEELDGVVTDRPDLLKELLGAGTTDLECRASCKTKAYELCVRRSAAHQAFMPPLS